LSAPVLRVVPQTFSEAPGVGFEIPKFVVSAMTTH